MKTLNLLLRGAIADNAQALHDAHAVAILRQQIRDAATALGGARRELAVAMAYRAAEGRALDALLARIESASAGACRALTDGREDLGREAAALIAALEDERADRIEAVAGFDIEIERLKRQAGEGEVRLRDLDRGLQMARAAESVRRAGINGRRVIAASSGALGEAEETLARLRQTQRCEEDILDAFAQLEAAGKGGAEARLDTAGYGKRRTDPQAVLERLRAKSATTPAC